MEIVSIPQAGSTVATQLLVKSNDFTNGFNTASGKYCCNPFINPDGAKRFKKVSIPQAVSTVATFIVNVTVNERYLIEFQYRKR